MGGFCPDDWHQTTEMDMQHRSLGGDEYLYEVWQTELALFSLPRPRISAERIRQHDAIAEAAYRLAQQRGLIPYTQETFAALMDEVEASSPNRKDVA